jgi:HAD superfamily hydrolase (TIGR01662 family)
MSTVKAVLFDRDGTLVEDVPYNGDPERVRPVEGAREALALLREHGIRTGVVTNQSGVARGLLTDADVRAVNRRIDDLLGPFDVWGVCPHGPDDDCHCRKPQPGLVLWAAGRICTAPEDCVVIGDIGADVEAARRAGAHGILVPTPETRPEETVSADHVAPDILTAVRAVLDGPPKGRVLADERPIEDAFDTGGSESAVTPRGSGSAADGRERRPAADPRGSGSAAEPREGGAATGRRPHGPAVDTSRRPR